MTVCTVLVCFCYVCLLLDIKINLDISLPGCCVDTSDTSVLWDTGPALCPLKEIWGCVGFCPTSPHVFFGLGEKAFDHSALRVWGLWPIATSCTFPIQQFEKLEISQTHGGSWTLPWLLFVTDPVHNFRGIRRCRKALLWWPGFLCKWCGSVGYMGWWSSSLWIEATAAVMQMLHVLYGKERAEHGSKALPSPMVTSSG